MCHVMEIRTFGQQHTEILETFGGMCRFTLDGTMRIILIQCALIPWSTRRKAAFVGTKQLIYLSSWSFVASAISLALVRIINLKRPATTWAMFQAGYNRSFRPKGRQGHL